jgi:hypothetical protein
MRKNLLTLMMGTIFLLAIMTTFVNAEVTFWTDINIDYDDQTVVQHGYYQFDDTSAKGIGRNKPIEVILWYDVSALPFNLNPSNYSGYVDWCNFTITQYKNEYGTEYIAWQGFVGGEYLDTTVEIDNYYFANTTASSGQLSYDLKDKDSLIIDMKCHYTDANSTFADSVLFGRFTTYFGAYECDDCEEYSLEELSNEIERNEQATAEGTEIYEKIQYVIDMNYNLWLIASWLIKIAFVFTALGLVFGGVYWLYLLFKNIEREI